MNITEARATCARLKSELADAEKLVAELEREPLRCWVNFGGHEHAVAYTTEAMAKGPGNNPDRTRIAVPMVELIPGMALVKESVRITDEQVQWASDLHFAEGSNRDALIAVMAYALSLAGVGVESQS